MSPTHASPAATTQLLPLGVVVTIVQVLPSPVENTSITWPLLASPIATGVSAYLRLNRDPSG